MLLGTHSSAGKSLLATAFCRILARKGYRVAPFKAQNMSNNAGVTPEGDEMGRAQIVQAEAAGVAPHTDMNPVLLKPEGDRRSQIVLNGKVYGHIDARNWMDIKRLLWDEVRAAYDRLASRFDVIVLEGAGSPAEVNLKAGDIVNLRMARHANAPALLVGDIDRGGVFAALAGTVLLLEPEERQQIRGFLINKFRGDPSLLGDGLRMLQERAFGVPTLGVIPYLNDLWIADEDAVTLERLEDKRRASGAGGVDIVVVYLPRIANLDEFDALAAEPGVRVRFVRRPEEVGQPQALILPGTKATLSDLQWLRAQGLDQTLLRLRAKGTEVVGVCGGYQMLGEKLSDPAGVESPPGTEAFGLGLLPVETVFNVQKQTDRVRVRLPDGETLSGYEIHAGETRLMPGAEPLGVVTERSGRPVEEKSGARGEGVWGTYLHDIFANDAFRRRWLRSLGWKGEGGDTAALREAAYDRLADAVEASVDWPRIAHMMGLEGG
jgi:adenosylcobyric acid synthase